MGNGTLTKREIADDIKRLENAEAPKSCTAFAIIRNALVRSLRVGEGANIIARQNRFLLIILLLLSFEVKEVGLVDLVLKLLSKWLTGGL